MKSAILLERRAVVALLVQCVEPLLQPCRPIVEQGFHNLARAAGGLGRVVVMLEMTPEEILVMKTSRPGHLSRRVEEGLGRKDDHRLAQSLRPPPRCTSGAGKRLT